jgi:hypothetical protein
MLVRVSRTLLLIGTFTLGGCVLPGGTVVRPIPGTPGAEVGSGPSRGLARKRVATKQEPYTLVAEDGTSCQVSADRFGDVSVGNAELCMWQ